jgi:Carboxypeptidase regulatory-like domain
VAGARIIVSQTGGGTPVSVVTDDQGGYAISLSPGTYRVTMEISPRIGFSRDLPATVTITEGHETRLDIRLDTGIR